MSLPKQKLYTSRRALLLGGGALALLAGCGFAPVYDGTRQTAGSLFGRMRYSVPESLAGYRLRQGLRDEFGEGEEMELRVALSISSNEAATTGSGATLRYTLIGTAAYTLRGADGKVLLNGSVDSFTGYSASSSTRATVRARQDAEERLAALLADRIARKLILTDLK